MPHPNFFIEEPTVSTHEIDRDLPRSQYSAKLREPARQSVPEWFAAKALAVDEDVVVAHRVKIPRLDKNMYRNV